MFLGTRLPPDQRQITTALPPHLVDVLFVNDAGKDFLRSISIISGTLALLMSLKLSFIRQECITCGVKQHQQSREYDAGLSMQ